MRLIGLEQKLAGSAALVGDRDALLNLILASHSWRMTKPLRFAGYLLRGEWSSVLAGLRHTFPSWHVPRLSREKQLETAINEAHNVVRSINTSLRQGEFPD
jgi:hypothetical protein